MEKTYKIMQRKVNTSRRNSSTVPKYWKGTKQAYWSDSGKAAKNVSYSKKRNTRRTDNPSQDGINKLKKYRYKLKVKSKKGKLYTRYIYRKPVKSSTISRYRGR